MAGDLLTEHRPSRYRRRSRGSNPESKYVASANDVGMKLVSYAGQQLITTDDVANALVTLAAAVAADGESAALQIPTLIDGEEYCADLIAGVGERHPPRPQPQLATTPTSPKKLPGFAHTGCT